MVLDGYPWPMLARIPMDLNSSSQLSKHHGLMGDMLFLAKLLKEWYVKASTKLHLCTIITCGNRIFHLFMQ